MIDFTIFQAAFPIDGPYPYNQTGVRSIETFRKSFDGVLFIDRVLKALDIGDGKVYPPKGENALRTLHRQICESKVSSHHKLSVLFYLLLDFDDVRGGRSLLAGALAEESGLPQTYQVLMRGLWHMDRKEFKFALEHLAHPSLPPSEFADDIIIALVRHAVGHDYSLPLAYYHTIRPIFKKAEALDLLFGALARTNVIEALYFLRAYPDHIRQQLFERLVSSVLDHPQAVGPRGRELVSLPLSSAEEKWLQDYLTAGDGKKSKNAKPVTQMRQIVTGRVRGSLTFGEPGGQVYSARAR
ncbi:nuclear pore complex assembly-domain-containing protein [Lasiosphaeria miniovina]|uniref:Nuclear pore complex assembly-domain-containing protein n=1 Tax=Lasiosphaeria miniovina TaxID=1954250 RepID=A0AA40ABX5_9PEZI|nr:nuclear pore complex assembly-domain-containing protein [Lasiosphaeria miniovina]KAK0713055.1 nuclear pore complex assembly-domain-containing protein [Lasiosphaeria miniovina]